MMHPDIAEQDDPGMSAADALCFLTPDLRQFLADLYGAPASIAQAAVQLLPFGSRSALLSTGLATADGSGSGPAGETGLWLTTLGFEVIAEAAMPAQPDEVDRLTSVAAAIVAEHNSCR
ncbi:hypothetical protein AB0M36_14250 [Actinoplanes sp. NPDC051346]|uniref:hypothetical protein n=1 Tax=Actinoplanes sp. NPDC051346 TaxID=3155048 RepID=UPI00342CF1BD